MKLGFVRAILDDQSLDEVLDFAAGENLSCVELMCWPAGKADRRYAGVTHVDVANLSDAQVEENQGVRIGIENCPMYFSDDEWPSGKNLAISPAVWRRLFNDIPSDALGLKYDPSHLIWQQMDYLKPMKEFSEKLFHIHAKDAKVDREALNDVGVLATPLEYHTPKLPGLGDIDWGSFFRVLGKTGYNGSVCIEVEDRAYEQTLTGCQSALRQSARYLRNFMTDELTES